MNRTNAVLIILNWSAFQGVLAFRRRGVQLNAPPMEYQSWMGEYESVPVLAYALFFVELDHVAFLQVIESLKTDAALVTFGDFFDIIGKAFERAELARE